MTRELSLRNCQARRRVDTRFLARNVRECLRILEVEFELGIRVVSNAEIARINERYLQHHGPTDVITFHYDSTQASIPDDVPGAKKMISGDIFVSVDEAVSQARRFRTSGREELLRYAVHGILHLLGFDDHSARDRRRMKKVEDQLVSRLTGRSRRPTSKRSGRHG